MTGTIGRPKRKEIVKVLIEEGGDCDKAAQKCCMNRMKMVCICFEIWMCIIVL